MFRDYLKKPRSIITVYYDAKDSIYAEQILVQAKDAYFALKNYFSIEKDITGIRLILVPNRDEFDRLVADLLRVPIERPSDPRRLAQPQRTDIVFMSPSSYKKHCAYDYSEADFRRMIKHELVHVFEEYLTPDMETTPGWWSEGLAVYLSEQWKYKSELGFCEPVINALESGKIPTINEILNDRMLRYTFGWTIVMYLEMTYGKDFIVNTVKTLTENDLLKAVGISQTELQKDWHKWMTSGELMFI